jgi:clan AA aspartic protease
MKPVVSSTLMKLTLIKRKDGSNMGLTRVVVDLKSLTSEDTFQSQFLVDTGAIDSVAPASALRKIGIKPIDKKAYELADGSMVEFEIGLVEIRFMGEITAGRVLFGPEDVEPILGVTALESTGMVVDPASRTLKRLPAIYLK